MDSQAVPSGQAHLMSGVISGSDTTKPFEAVAAADNKSLCSACFALTMKLCRADARARVVKYNVPYEDMHAPVVGRSLLQFGQYLMLFCQPIAS